MEHFEDLNNVLDRTKIELMTVFQNKTRLIGRDGIRLKFKVIGYIRPNFILVINSLFGENWSIEPGSHYNLYLYVIMQSKLGPQPKEGIL